MHVYAQIISWGSVVVGFVAAWLWYRASTVIIRKGDPKSKGGFYLGPDDPPIDVYSTVAEASRINKQAALATAAAVLRQALSTIVTNLA